MACLFLDSANYFVTADITKKWTALQFNGGFPSPVIGAYGRHASNGYRFTFQGSANTSSNINKTLAPTGSRFVYGCAYRYTDAIPSFSVPFFAVRNNAVPQIGLSQRQDGKIELYNGSSTNANDPATLLAVSTAPLSSGIYYFLELDVTIASSGGTAALRINNLPDIAFTGNTQHDSSAAWDVLSVGLQFVSGTFFGLAAATLDFCDIRIFDGKTTDRDGHPTANYQPIGDRQVLALHVQTGNGAHADFTPTSGSNHGDMVKDLVSDGDTTTNASSTVGQKDSYPLDDLAAGTVAAAQTVLVARKVDAGDRLVSDLLRLGGIDYEGPDLAPNETYNHLLTPYDNSPATLTPFTVAEINAAEAGVVITG